MLFQNRRDIASTGGSHKMRMKQDTAYLHTKATNIFIFVRYPRQHHVWKAWRVEFNGDARRETERGNMTWKPYLLYESHYCQPQDTVWTTNAVLAFFARWYSSCWTVSLHIAQNVRVQLQKELNEELQCRINLFIFHFNTHFSSCEDRVGSSSRRTRNTSRSTKNLR